MERPPADAQPIDYRGEPALRRRYGAAAPDTADVWSDAIELMLAHRSVRAYTDEPLPDGTLEAIVAAAQSASTSSNLQMWSVIAVEDAERKAALSMLAGDQKHIREAPLFLVFVADHARLRDAGAGRAIPTDGLDFLETFLVGIVDAALAAQNAAVAAESLGLGTVYIGGMRNHPEETAATLGLPPHVMAVFGMCVGHADPQRPAAVKPRMPQRLVLHREVYSPDARDADLAGYDATLRAFQAEAGMKLADWTQFATRRVSGAGSLNGRDRLREAAAKLGFEVR